MQNNYYMPEMTPGMEREMMCCRMSYPEVYYKLQPFVFAMCDQMGGYMMPTQDMVDQMSDDIYMDVTTMYPDMAEYAREYEVGASVETSQFGRDFDRGNRGRFRRRGVFRDVIDILLLNELFRRGRWFY